MAGTLRILIDVKTITRAGAAEGLTLVAHRTQAVAVPRTPLADGDLRDSIVVDPASPDDLEAATYTDSPYARRQHEELNYHHKHGQAKFLESAAQDVADEVPAIMATAARRAMGG